MKGIDWKSFFTDILSVVLGIFITFGIQGMIDRKHEKKEVTSALELVREELANNLTNLREVIDLINSEKSAAISMSGAVGSMQKYDADSLTVWNSYLGTEYFFTVTDDALELLKSSSLFQKINDKNLALGIIKSYDYLEADAKAFNTHEEYKVSLFMDLNTDKMKKAALNNNGPALLKTFYSNTEAVYFLKSVIEMCDDSYLRAGLPEIEATLADIGSRVE